MKKILGVILIFAGLMNSLIMAMILFKIRSNEPSNTAIIGGADGPTVIFLAGEIGLPIFAAIVAGVITFVIGLVLVLMKKK